MFGVPSGKLLGFLVSHRGVEANLEKVKAIEVMSPPQTLKEMQKLAGRVTALGRFISKLGERALPFFKLMKKKGPFEWTREADRAFQDLKRFPYQPSGDGGTTASQAPGTLPCRHPVLRQRGAGGGSGGAPRQGCAAPSQT